MNNIIKLNELIYAGAKLVGENLGTPPSKVTKKQSDAKEIDRFWTKIWQQKHN